MTNSFLAKVISAALVVNLSVSPVVGCKTRQHNQGIVTATETDVEGLRMAEAGIVFVAAIAFITSGILYSNRSYANQERLNAYQEAANSLPSIERTLATYKIEKSDVERLLESSVSRTAPRIDGGRVESRGLRFLPFPRREKVVRLNRGVQQRPLSATELRQLLDASGRPTSLEEMSGAIVTEQGIVTISDEGNALLFQDINEKGDSLNSPTPSQGRTTALPLGPKGESFSRSELGW